VRLSAVLCPDPVASARLFSLFAHLASLANTADPEQGGTLLEQEYAGLPAMLAPEAPAPEWSGTYCIRLAGKKGDRRLANVVLGGGRPDLLCRRDNGIRPRGVEQSEFSVAPGCGHLDRGKRGHKIRIDRDRRPCNGKILHRPQRVDAVIDICGNVALAQQIVFASRGHRNLPPDIREDWMKSGCARFSKHAADINLNIQQQYTTTSS
jgi:hypothetical protein